MFWLYIINQWLYILILFTDMIDNYRMIMLTQVQGHKVKGQGQICNFVKKDIFTVFHEQMIGHWWYSHTWLISIRCRSWLKVRVTGQRSRSNMQVVKKNLVLIVIHEPMIGYGWYLHTWLVSLRCWSWLKVKVTRS